MTKSDYGYETEHVGNLGITIVKGYRNIRIGKAIVREIIKRARKRFEILEVNEVFSNNEPAKRLYEGVGFRMCGIMSRHIKRGKRHIDSETMTLRLR